MLSSRDKIQVSQHNTVGIQNHCINTILDLDIIGGSDCKATGKHENSMFKCMRKAQIHSLVLTFMYLHNGMENDSKT